MDDEKLEKILEEFLRIYSLPVDDDAEVDEGGTYPAIDYIIKELGKVFEVRKISDRGTVLLNEKSKIGVFIGLCNRSCKYLLCFLFCRNCYLI